MTTIYYRIVWDFIDNNNKIISGNGQRIPEEEAKQWIAYYDKPKNNPLNIRHFIQREFKYSHESFNSGFCVGVAKDGTIEPLKSYFS